MSNITDDSNLIRVEITQLIPAENFTTLDKLASYISSNPNKKSNVPVNDSSSDWYKFPLKSNLPLIDRKKPNIPDPPKTINELVDEPWRLQPPHYNDTVSPFMVYVPSKETIYQTMNSGVKPTFLNTITEKSLGPENFNKGDFHLVEDNVYVSSSPKLIQVSNLWTNIHDNDVSCATRCPAAYGFVPTGKVNTAYAGGNVSQMCECKSSRYASRTDALNSAAYKVKPDGSMLYPCIEQGYWEKTDIKDNGSGDTTKGCIENWGSAKYTTFTFRVFIFIRTKPIYWLECCANTPTVIRNFCPTAYRKNSDSSLCKQLGNTLCSPDAETKLNPLCGCYDPYIKHMLEQHPDFEKLLGKYDYVRFPPACSASCGDQSYRNPDLLKEGCNIQICNAEVKAADGGKIISKKVNVNVKCGSGTGDGNGGGDSGNGDGNGGDDNGDPDKPGDDPEKSKNTIIIVSAAVAAALVLLLLIIAVFALV